MQAIKKAVAGIKGTPPDDKITMQWLLDEAKKNYEELKKKSGKEAEEMRQKMNKMNEEFAVKMKQLRENSKKQLQDKYRDFASKASELSGQQVKELKAHMKAMVAKYGDHQSGAYQDTVKKIDEFQGKSKGDVENWVNQVNENIDTVHNDALKKLSVPT